MKAPARPYRSRLDTPALIAKARAELKGETLLAFLLALGAGLRWSEIKALQWWDVSTAAPEIHLTPRTGYSGKTESSLAPVRLDDLTHSLILHFRRQEDAPESAIIRATEKARKELTAWLRRNGLDVEKPIHELRKEYGALIATRHGIYAASRALRHANISMTAAIYADLKTSPAPGIFA